MASLMANASPPKAESPPKTGDDKDKPKPVEVAKPKKFLNGSEPRKTYSQKSLSMMIKHMVI